MDENNTYNVFAGTLNKGNNPKSLNGSSLFSRSPFEIICFELTGDNRPLKRAKH